MCGIAGVCGLEPQYEAIEFLNTLSKSLAHRGADGTGRYVDDHVGLHHSRLSIMDLSVHGNQPLYNEDKSLVLVCNGHIYNYSEIRKELIDKGHTFSSHSDCEVILHLYEENRDAPELLLKRLTGMFAFALWDTQNKKLLVARDRVGIKPMYYSYKNNTLLFSSEVKPLSKTTQVSPEIDYTSLYEYFMLGMIPGPNTMYADIKCLEAGHYMTFEDNQLSIKEYWDIPTTSEKWTSEKQVIDSIEEQLSTIIKDHLVADVPVGTFLSGGVDSSLITDMAVKLHPGIHSFTASFPGEPEDEGAVAAQTAKKLGTVHSSFELKNNFFSDYDEQFKDLDQPFGIISALALGRISKMAKQQVKVVLSGDGGDELFGGYNRHQFPKDPSFLKYIPASLSNNVLKVAAAITGKQSLEKLRLNLLETEGEKFLSRITISDTETVLSLFSPAIREKIDTGRFLKRLNHLFDSRKDKDALNRVLYVDMKTTLVDEMLTKCDRMSLKNGIEGRVPFLDQRLVEMAFTIPGKYKRTDSTGKIVLRKILAKRLGAELAYGVKTGFNSPFEQKLKSEAATRTFVQDHLDGLGLLEFMNSAVIATYKKNLTSVNSRVLFCLVCLNEYIINLGDYLIN